MTEIILTSVLAVIAVSAIGAILYVHRVNAILTKGYLNVIQNAVAHFTNTMRDTSFEFLQRQRELEEFAFIEAKERRVYVDLAQKKIERYGTPDFMPPIHPAPSADASTSWPVDFDFEEMVASGVRRGRPRPETEPEEPGVNG